MVGLFGAFEGVAAEGEVGDDEFVDAGVDIGLDGVEDVVFGAAEDGATGGAGLVEAGLVLGLDEEGAGAALDFGGIAADVLAVVVEDVVLVGEDFGGAPDVPFVGVLGGDAEGAFFAAAADHEGEGSLDGLGFEGGVDELVVSAGEVGFLVAEEFGDELAGFFEAVEAFFEGEEGDAVGAVLVFLPGRAEAEGEAAAGDDVEFGGHFGDDGWVSVGVAGDEVSDADSGDADGECGEGDPAFVDGAGGVLLVGHEVVGEPEAVPAGGFGVSGDGEDFGPGVAGAGPEAESHDGAPVLAGLMSLAGGEG